MPENSPRGPTLVKLVSDLLVAGIQVRCSVLSFKLEYPTSTKAIFTILGILAGVTLSLLLL
jgi:hypothetical protein